MFAAILRKVYYLIVPKPRLLPKSKSNKHTLSNTYPLRETPIDKQIIELKTQVLADKQLRQRLGAALHRGGLEGFAEEIECIGLIFNYTITAADFVAHVHRFATKPALYVVSYCGGGVE